MKKHFIKKDYIHEWFELSYANYLVLHRSVLQSMPLKWQKRFVKCLEELDIVVEDLKDIPTEFWVRAKKNGKFITDNYSNYERGRKNIFKD